MDKVIDHFNGNEITYPPKKKVVLKYDFHFRKAGSNVWRYMNSADDLAKFAKQIETVRMMNGEYQIVESATGKVIG